MNPTLKFSGTALLAMTLMACNRQAEAPQPAPAPTPATVAAPAADPAPVDAPDHLSIQVSDGRILTQEGVGAVEGNVLTGTGKAGVLAFGPYAPLAAGDYSVRFTGSIPTLPAGANVRFDVGSARGAQIHGERLISAPHAETGEIAQLDFSLATAAADIELRVIVPEGAKVVLQSYTVSKR